MPRTPPGTLVVLVGVTSLTVGFLPLFRLDGPPSFLVWLGVALSLVGGLMAREGEGRPAKALALLGVSLAIVAVMVIVLVALVLGSVPGMPAR